MTRRMIGACAVVALFCGCGTQYCWRTTVPASVRKVCVPTFRNESKQMEMGAIATRQILRELQREGTFKICRPDEAALEIQGVIKSASASSAAYDRRSMLQISAYNMTVTAEISVIDKRRGAVLVNNRPYTATTTFTGGQDQTTSLRDASSRAMDELSRLVVDDLLRMSFDEKESKK